METFVVFGAGGVGGIDKVADEDGGGAEALGHVGVKHHAMVDGLFAAGLQEKLDGKKDEK